MPLKPWKIIHSHYLIKDRWLTVRVDRCETAGGVTIEPFYVLEKKDWVHVVAFDKDNHILIVRQYRHGAQKICTEIPCGVVDESDQSALTAIRRELLEETGCEAEQIECLGTVYANPARQTNHVHSFIAFGVRQVAEQKMDESEAIEFEFMDIETVMRLIDSGEFAQSLHITSIFLALRRCGLLNRAGYPI